MNVVEGLGVEIAACLSSTAGAVLNRVLETEALLGGVILIGALEQVIGRNKASVTSVGLSRLVVPLEKSTTVS